MHTLLSAYVPTRLIFWIGSLIIIAMPFYFYETAGGLYSADWGRAYVRHYRAILVVYMCFLSFALLDLHQLLAFALRVHSLVSIATAPLVVGLLIFIVWFGMAIVTSFSLTPTMVSEGKGAGGATFLLGSLLLLASNILTALALSDYRAQVSELENQKASLEKHTIELQAQIATNLIAYSGRAIDVERRGARPQ